MAKKKKQKKASKGNEYFEPMEITRGEAPEKQTEQIVKREFSHSLSNLHRIEKEHPNFVAYKDMDSHHYKRRVRAAVATAPRIVEMAEKICPDIPGLFSIVEDWARINAFPVKSYDAQEEDLSLILGASIWMLDRIKWNGRIREAIQLLPKDEESLDEIEIPDIYDPVHREEVIRAMVYAIRHRNDDCLQPGQKAKKKNKHSDPLERVLADRFTAKGEQHQAVPSRERFEKLLALIPQSDKDRAAKNYEDRLFAWIERYYRCRAQFCEKERAVEQHRKEFVARADTHLKQLLEDRKKTSEAFKGMSPAEAITSDPLQQSFYNMMNSEPAQLMKQVEEESREIETEIDDLEMEITKFIYTSHRFGMYSYDRTRIEIGEEIADIVSDFSYGDPYEVCFALLYLLDRDSDLPWLYYPGIVLSENAGAMLPWFDCIYKESEDDHWAQYYDTEYKPIEETIKHVPELADWYHLDYVYKQTAAEYQFRNNLAQIVFDVTGGLMPRDLHRYDDEIAHLRAHGINGKKMQIPLLYCMTLLGEGRFQTEDWRMRLHIQDEMMDDLLETVQAKIEESIPETAPDDALREQVLALKKEYEQLKQIAYQSEREVKELQKKNDALYQKGQTANRELAELRELVFLRENEMEPELIQGEEPVQFPYTVKRSTVIFGGHETWAKAIRPMLAGDVRFVDRGMRPDADLIRHAEVVWLQPNSLRHSDYYKIIRVVRSHEIPFHYFQFASAEKCAVQLIREDQKDSR